MDFTVKRAIALLILRESCVRIESMMIKRYLNLRQLLRKKSFLLFGPRAVGKSTLITQQLRDRVVLIDLLDERVLLEFTAEPERLEAMAMRAKPKIVAIDEVQRLPQLLNDVHRLIEREGVRFLLTGSSMRKLRRGGTNLLAGRAWLAHLFPLTFGEIDGFDLERYLHYGGLPAVYTSKHPDEELNAYISVYLKEEIREEGIVRQLPPFTRFLRTMALANCELINFNNISSDCQVAASTVREYVQILEDTLLGLTLQPWRASQRRKATSTAKFYFFDTGVARVLAGIKHTERSSASYGKSFELFILMELRAYLSYTRQHMAELHFWRSRYGHEVDFLVGEELAIEVKASTNTSARDLKGLQALSEENVFKKYYLVSQDRMNRKQDIFHLVHWQTFLQELWDGQLL